MHTIKLSTVYQLVLTALVLGACFGTVAQGNLGNFGIQAAPTTPTPMALAQANTNQLALDTTQNGPKVQVQVQVDATGNANAEGSAKGPNDTNVTAKTNGEGSAVASALSSLPQNESVVASAPPVALAPFQPTPTISLGTVSGTRTNPQAVVNEAIVNLRQGPGTFYETAGTAARGQVFELVARSEDYHWWQVCCHNNGRVWLSDQVAYVYGQLNALPVVANPVQPAPLPAEVSNPTGAVALVATLPAPTAVPTAELAPTATPQAFDFDLLAHEQFEERILPRIYAYVYAGAEGLGGYTLRVRKDGIELPAGDDSFGGQPAMTWPLSIARQRFYNLKFEYSGLPAAGAWEIQLVDSAGKAVGPPALFNLSGDEPNQEMYVRYQKR